MRALIPVLAGIMGIIMRDSGEGIADSEGAATTEDEGIAEGNITSIGDMVGVTIAEEKAPSDAEAISDDGIVGDGENSTEDEPDNKTAARNLARPRTRAGMESDAARELPARAAVMMTSRF